MKFKQFFQRSLKTRLTLFTLAISLVCVWSLAFYARMVQRDNMERQLSDQQFSIVSLLADSINEDIDDRLQALQAVAARVTPALLANAPALQPFLEQNPVLENLFNAGSFITTADGTPVADIPRSADRIGRNVMDRDYMLKALKEGKASVGRPVLGKSLGTPVFSMAAPIRDAQGKAIGAVVGVIDLGKPSFLAKITEHRYGKTGDYFLAAPQYRLNVTSSDKTRIMQPFPAPGVSPAMDRFIDGYEGSALYVNSLGIEVLVSAKRMPVPGWVIVASLPSEEAFAPIRVTQQRMAWIVLLFTLLGGSLIWWTTSRMLHRQLAPMLDATRKLATLSDGSPARQTLGTNSHDEIGELIGGFNRLLDTLAHREDALRASQAQVRVSEQRFRSFVENLNDVVFTLTTEGVFSYVSPRWQEFFGYELNETIGQPFLPFVHPDDVAACLAFLQQVLTTGDRQSGLEYRVLCKDGRYLWYTANGSLISDPVTGTSTLLGVGRDITERKRIEERLRTSDEKHRILLDESSDPIFSFYPDGRYSYVNAAFAAPFGKTPADIIEKTVWDVFPDDEAQKRFNGVRAIFESGKEHVSEVRVPTPKGDLYMITTAKPIFNERQQVLTVICISKDITERKHAEVAAHAANRAKSEFLSNMSHEIRTPLNGVVGMVDLLQETELSAGQQRMLDTIQDSSLALLHILNDILDYSKIEAGKLEVEQVPTHLREVTEGVAQLMITASTFRSIELSVFVSPQLPHWILCDPNRLRQVLLNLLGNALKFTAPREGGPGRVMLRVDACTLAQGDAGVRISVIDNGIGIGAEAQKSLFLPFMQADESTARKFGGTGLGLSISRRLVELLHGRISVRSTLGEGSEFRVELPLHAAEPARVVAEEASLAGVHVLVLSHAPAAMEIVPSYCAAAGAQVTLVTDPRDVRQLSRAGQPTVVVLGLSVTLSNVELALPPQVAVVRLVRRSSQTFVSEITVHARPLSYHDLIQGVALASGRLSVPGLSQRPERRRGRTRTAPPTVEQAACRSQLILLAEDNQTNRDVILEQLTLLGYAAEVATDGAMALAMWRRGLGQRYALLLTDCHMPNMDGFELTQAVRESEPAGTHIPIIAVTANAMQGESQRCLARGMDDYLSKPLRLQELGPMLAKWLPLPGQVMRATPPANALDGTGPELAVWHVATLGELVGDNPATHRRLLERFLLNAADQVSDIEEAATAGELDRLATAAHTLKSAARSVGALALGELCQTLEHAGRAGDGLNCSAQATKLGPAFATAAQAIKQHLAS